MILTIIIIEILILVLACVMWYLAEDNYSTVCGVVSFLMFCLLIVLPIAVGTIHGYVDYKPSEDRDKARITAVTQEQTAFNVYYRVEVEYLTNTPTQEGVIQNKYIEKDIFYCYYDDKELVEKLKNNLYKELWLISGYKGGYESAFKDFGNKLIKDIELIEE